MPYPNSVINAARRYAAHIRKMQNTYDREELAILEDERNRLHNEYLEALRSEGMKLTRQESENMAWKL